MWFVAITWTPWCRRQSVNNSDCLYLEILLTVQSAFMSLSWPVPASIISSTDINPQVAVHKPKLSIFKFFSVFLNENNNWNIYHQQSCTDFYYSQEDELRKKIKQVFKANIWQQNTYLDSPLLFLTLSSSLCPFIVNNQKF